MAPEPSGNYRANEHGQKPQSQGLGTWVQSWPVCSPLAHMWPEPHPARPGHSWTQVLVPTAVKDEALVQNVAWFPLTKGRAASFFMSRIFRLELGYQMWVVMYWQVLVANQWFYLLLEWWPIDKDKWTNSIQTSSVGHWRKLSDTRLVRDVPIHSSAVYRGLVGPDVRCWERGFLKKHD